MIKIHYFRDHPNFNSENGFAEKLCESDGSWWIHPVSNLTWSNYTHCVPQGIPKNSKPSIYNSTIFTWIIYYHWELSNNFYFLGTFHQAMSIVNVVGNAMSLIFLLISLLIFQIFRNSLSCGRITMHKNLFLAFSFRNGWYQGSCWKIDSYKT